MLEGTGGVDATVGVSTASSEGLFAFDDVWSGLIRNFTKFLGDESVSLGLGTSASLGWTPSSSQLDDTPGAKVGSMKSKI